MVTTKNITWREYLVEFLTAYTFTLVMSLSFFRITSALAYIIGAIFFAFLYVMLSKRMLAFGNPVISVSMLFLRKVSLKLGIALVAFQIAAGTLAGLTLYGLVDNMTTRIGGINSFAQISFSSGLGEFLGSAFFVMGILALVALHKNNNATEGSSAFNMFFVMYASMLTGVLFGSVGFINPAVAFGLGLHFNVVYTVIPLVGALVGALIYRGIIEGKSLKPLFKANTPSSM